MQVQGGGGGGGGWEGEVYREGCTMAYVDCGKNILPVEKKSEAGEIFLFFYLFEEVYYN